MKATSELPTTMSTTSMETPTVNATSVQTSGVNTTSVLQPINHRVAVNPTSVQTSSVSATPLYSPTVNTLSRYRSIVETSHVRITSVYNPTVNNTSVHTRTVETTTVITTSVNASLVSNTASVPVNSTSIYTETHSAVTMSSASGSAGEGISATVKVVDGETHRVVLPIPSGSTATSFSSVLPVGSTSHLAPGYASSESSFSTLDITTELSAASQTFTSISTNSLGLSSMPSGTTSAVIKIGQKSAVLTHGERASEALQTGSSQLHSSRTTVEGSAEGTSGIFGTVSAPAATSSVAQGNVDQNFTGSVASHRSTSTSLAKISSSQSTILGIVNHLASVSSQIEVFSAPTTPLTPSGFHISSVTAVKDRSSLMNSQKAISTKGDGGMLEVPSQTTGSNDNHGYLTSIVVSQSTSVVDYSVSPETGDVSWEGRGISRLSSSLSQNKSIVEHTTVSKGVEFATASTVASHSSLKFKEASTTFGTATQTALSTLGLDHGRDTTITASTSQYMGMAGLHGTGASGGDLSSSSRSGSENMMGLETHFTGAATRFRSNSFGLLTILVAGLLLL